MLQRLADSMILCPSKEDILIEHKTRRTLTSAGGEIDLWVQRCGVSQASEPEVFVLKFGGAGSRAERATMHPLDFWTDFHAEIWAPNWPGFGGSSGRASVQPLADVGVHCYEQLRRVAGERPIVVTGNSLGTTVALHVGAKFRDMAGLILRNPPPLRKLIVGRHGWYSAWVGAWVISRCVPHALNSTLNARGCDVPAVFVTSGKDRIVPPSYQSVVFDAYAGPKRQLVLHEADHLDFPTDAESVVYRQELQWLRRRAELAAGNGAPA